MPPTTKGRFQLYSCSQLELQLVSSANHLKWNTLSYFLLVPNIMICSNLVLLWEEFDGNDVRRRRSLCCLVKLSDGDNFTVAVKS